ncbi:MAG: YbcC family protein [Acidithiobacillus sp.]
MKAPETSAPHQDIKANIEGACQRIAPLWPLKHFVAVNPYFGLRDQPFWQADQTLRKMTGEGLTMPRPYYEEQIANGRITQEDLNAALQEMHSIWDVTQLKQAMKQRSASRNVPFPVFADAIFADDHRDWPGFVVERISQYCAAYFDEGQAAWSMPWRDGPLYQGWLKFMHFDKSPRMIGLRGIGEATAALPAAPETAVAWALKELSVPFDLIDDYLFAALLSIGGWAGWARYVRWQAELKGETNHSLRDLLAVRVCWDAILHKTCADIAVQKQWRLMLHTQQNRATGKPSEHVDAILQTALEIGYQRSLFKSLKASKSTNAATERPVVQAAFCIDVRSEIIRRALETVAPGIQTLGFAGFFGVLMEYVPFGANAPKGHLPVIFNPPYRVCEDLSHAGEDETQRQVAKRQLHLRVATAWKSFKTSAVSTFTFVEATGLLYAPKLFGDSMGWTRTVPHPDERGLNIEMKQRLRPQLVASGNCKSSAKSTGIPEGERAGVGEFILKNMGLTQTFARLILLAGHGSTTVNNPQGTGLDCGACAGQTGEASARIAVTLLNDPATRRGLEEKGLRIPEDTYFIAGLHDTTTDEVMLFDTQDLPATHAKDLAQLRQWLADAGALTRMERATLLGTASQAPDVVTRDMQRRTRDWAEVRPEWALAGNAAFIAAPRQRTRGVDLEGRAFLHDYDWQKDAGFSTLELIMTAPMVVANWINMQYYGSMVDNLRFGSGNKVLHNVVGGSIGVLEGNGGDLRVGFALQSLHDGNRWVHEPVRLNVLIEAPQAEMESVISRHALVRELVDNGWLYLFQIDDAGSVYRRVFDKQWQRMT